MSRFSTELSKIKQAVALISLDVNEFESLARDLGDDRLAKSIAGFQDDLLMNLSQLELAIHKLDKTLFDKGNT